MTANAELRTVDSEIIALAEDEYAAAAETARIEVREIHTADEAAKASLLLDEVWNVDETGTNVFEPSLIIAFAHAGNYVSAAYSADDPEEMIGVTIGFFGQPLGTVMHSHIAGVRHQVIGRGAGSAMKLHQRRWVPQPRHHGDDLDLRPARGPQRLLQLPASGREHGRIPRGLLRADARWGELGTGQRPDDGLVAARPTRTGGDG